MIYFGTGIGN